MSNIEKSDNQNPWGKGNNGRDKDGPPNIEEMLKNLFSGNKKKSRGNKGFKGPNLSGSSINFKLIIPVILVIIAAIWFVAGFYVVQPAQNAAVLRFGEYQRTEKPGLHWHPVFIETIKRVDVDQIRTSSLNKDILTSKENIVHVLFSVQYRAGDIKKYLFNVTDPEGLLSKSLDTAVRQTIGQHELEKVMTTQRAEITNEVEKELKTIINKYNAGLVVNEVVMKSAKAPDPVKPAFDDVIKAREDRQKVRNQAKAYANDIIPQARGKAHRIIAQAKADKQQTVLRAKAKVATYKALLPQYESKPDIIRSQIYFDTMQQVLQDNQVFVVDGKGNNNLLYNTGSSNVSSSKLKEAFQQYKMSDQSQNQQSSNSGNQKDSAGNQNYPSSNYPSQNVNNSRQAAKRNELSRRQYLRWLEANQ